MGTVTALELSGSMIVSGSQDGYVRAVDAATGSESSHAPLWQSLHVGSECMAMIDGAWRRCKVVSTVHAGYENARYRVAPNEVLDVAAMKHIAYVFDALIYYMRSGTDAAAAVRNKDG